MAGGSISAAMVVSDSGYSAVFHNNLWMSAKVHKRLWKSIVELSLLHHNCSFARSHPMCLYA